MPTFSSKSTSLFQTTLAYLSDRNQKTYLFNILRRSTETTKSCLADGVNYIEIAFPEERKSDISVSESLDINRAFVKDFAEKFRSYGKDLWILFPDKKESNLAAQKWGKGNSFTLTSIETAIEAVKANKDIRPKLMIVVNPGFNVEEWINLSFLDNICPMVIINGNLDRLRNGYYPRLFYPGLGRVTDSFYSKFTQSFFLSAVAVGGDRMGSWLYKAYPADWELLVKDKTLGYETISTFDKCPNPQKIWKTAKASYSEKWGNMF